MDVGQGDTVMIMEEQEMGSKRRRMTNREKAADARIRKEMQEKGIIPPDKPRLNRKKYVEEAGQEWNGRDRDCCIWDVYLCRAVSIMLGKVDRDLRTSQEAVGAAKCLKLAIRLKEFSDRIRSEGRSEYTYGELHGYIRDILDA